MYNRSYAFEIERGKEYEFVITATNKYGESSMEQDIKRIKVLDGRCINNSASFLWQSQRIPKVVHDCRQTSSSTRLFVKPLTFFFTKKVYRKVLLGEVCAVFFPSAKNCRV